MSLTAERFPEYFAAVNHGNPPFAWQERLLRHVLQHANWPDAINAPTGTGKTAIVDIHIFLNALHAVRACPRIPRRLVTVVDRRSLVDHQAERTRNINELLMQATSGILLEVRDALNKLHSPTVSARLLTRHENHIVTPDVVVHSVLRGALPRDDAWLNHPTACAVINATPDMAGSRLLFGGYGSTKNARPREAGLLAYDTVMMVDEAHLNRQLLVTARRIADLETLADHAPNVPTLQVIETTATADPTDPVRTVGVLPHDLDPVASSVLAARLTTPKPLSYVPSPTWPSNGKGAGRSKPAAAHIDLIAEQAKNLSQRPRETDQPHTVGVIVNSVATALRVTSALRKAGLCVVTWVGPQRQLDRARIQSQYPGVMSIEGNRHVDVVVATQTLEVGVDLDFAALVTELAPGSALAQRFGRVNRRGLRATGPVTVVGPIDEATASKDSSIYAGADLQAAWLWLRTIDDVSPWLLTQYPPPTAQPRRVLFQRPELYDAHRWSLTSDSLHADEHLELWLHDDLSTAPAQASLVMRSSLPKDDADAVALLTATPPHAAEAFTTTLWTLRNVLNQLIESPDETQDRRVWVYREGALHRLQANSSDLEETASVLTTSSLKPGDIAIVPAGLPLTQHGVLVEEEGEVDADLALAWGDPDQVWAILPADLENGHGGHAAPPKGLVTLNTDDWFDLIADAEPDDIEEIQAELSQQASAADGETTWVVSFAEVAPNESTPWIVLRASGQLLDDPEGRQTMSSSDVVTLEHHQAAVQHRARLFAEMLGLHHHFQEVQSLAGLHHDDGKADQRFQRILHGQTPRASVHEVLAKSSPTTAARRTRALRSSGVPRGWRHEQASAVVTWMADGVRDHPHRDLVVRLVGTSHGRGRSTFPLHIDGLMDGAQSQAHNDDSAHALFVEGKWDTLLDSTHRRYGVWGCAYLEALLRAADAQVSQEGS